MGEGYTPSGYAPSPTSRKMEYGKVGGYKMGAGYHPRHIDILLCQHCSLHVQKDVLPLRICVNDCATCPQGGPYALC